ncbi:MAG: GNAT family N-acetyltransferase [Candidatus Omnitrophica bacterium]|nr:GNAT family N-acetyltransferase [Candidatus Omnitrophota bacterium]
MDKIDTTLFRKYNNGDEKQIVDLYNRCFVLTRPRMLDDWYWEFKNGLDGNAVIYVAELEGSIVGHFSGVPFKFKLGNNTLTAYYALDLMVSPECRRKGIATSILKTSIGSGVLENSLSYGMANDIHLSLGTRKFNYLTLGFIPRFIKDNSGWFSFSRIKNVFNIYSKKRIKITSIDSFDEEANEFWAKVSKNYSAATVRDADYLNWRYVSKPYNNYKKFLIRENGEIVGYFVLECKTVVGLIVEILIDCRKDVVNAALDFIGNFFKEKGIQQVVYYGLDEQLCPWLKSNRFVVSGNSELQFVIKNTNYFEGFNIALDKKNWLLSYGDMESL